MQKRDTQNERIKTGEKPNYRFWKRKKVVVVNKIQLYFELNKLLSILKTHCAQAYRNETYRANNRQRNKRNTCIDINTI